MGVKNCPETPRQKMINMMYLVLLAMMALNVASEVLDAFRVVDSSLIQTFKSVELKNDQLYASFSKAYAENPLKVKEWKDKSDEVKAKTDTLINRITRIKEQIALKARGTNINKKEGASFDEDRSFIVNVEGDTIQIKKDDELNVPSAFMIRLKNAEKLKQDIIEYKDFLIALLDENSPLVETIEQELDTSDPKVKLKEGGDKKTWEIQNFENKPLIAVITLLSKLQIDIQNAETNVLSYLYGQIDAGSFKFNKLGARVIAKSAYVLEGDVYRAEVFLAAEDTTQQPEIFVNNQQLKIVDGKGIYEIRANSSGTFKWGGIIKYKTPEGDFNTYPFEEEYQVSKPSVTISPTKMNVFYMGVPNPVSVSVPGVPSENLQVTMTNGNIEKSGNDFIVRPQRPDINGRNTRVLVKADFNGEVRDMGSMVFRVKEVPDPIATIAQKNGGILRKEDLLAEQAIFADMVDFDFELNFTVTSFDVSLTGAGGYVNTWPSESNLFTNDQKTQFRNLPPGSIIYIDKIFARGDDGSNRELTPISFKIR